MSGGPQQGSPVEGHGTRGDREDLRGYAFDVKMKTAINDDFNPKVSLYFLRHPST